MKKALITALAITLQTSCALAGVPLRFNADAAHPATHQDSAYRGETIDIEARLLWRGAPLEVAPGAGAALYWQTNGMGSAWWTAPASVTTNGVVSAVWSPTNDVGAAAYRLFLGVADGGANYRANMLLRMIDAPGAEPNTLAPPLRTIDFSLVEVANAPWIEEESDPVWEAEKGGYATTGYVSRAISDIDIPDPDLSFTNDFVKTESDPVWEAEKNGYATTNDLAGKLNLSGGQMGGWLDFGKWSPVVDAISLLNVTFRNKTVYTGTGVAIYGNASTPRFLRWPNGEGHFALSNDVAAAYQNGTNYTAGAVAGLRDEIEAGWWSEWRYISHSDPYTPQQGRTLRYLGNNTWSFGRYVDGTWVSDDTIAAPENATSFYFVDQGGDGVTATRRRVAAPVPTKADDIGAQPAGDYATPDDIADEIFAASNALARAWSADSVLLSMLLQGSNVVAEVTNYNSQVRSPSLRLLQLNASNEYDVVWSELTNLSKVAQDASDHADAVAAAALNTSTNYAAPRAWSGTTSGLGAEAPAGWTWISTPNLAIGGGLEFEKHATSGGAVWVLRNNGMVAQMNALTNNTAYLEISSLDGESVFRIEKTDAQTLGVNTARVSVDGSTLICGVDVVSASPPLVRLKTSLSQGEWVREEDGIPPSLADVQWEGESGAWVCRITNNSGGHSLFATMAVIQEGGTKIVPAAPMDAGAGILCTDGHTRIRPVNNNGAITWEIIQ